MLGDAEFNKQWNKFSNNVTLAYVHGGTPCKSCGFRVCIRGANYVQHKLACVLAYMPMRGTHACHYLRNIRDVQVAVLSLNTQFKIVKFCSTCWPVKAKQERSWNCLVFICTIGRLRSNKKATSNLKRFTNQFTAGLPIHLLKPLACTNCNEKLVQTSRICMYVSLQSAILRCHCSLA